MNFMRTTVGQVLALAAICVLVVTGLTIAASHKSSARPAHANTTMKLPTKIVPNVVGSPYVFAEGTLQARGFGWRVEGKVAGWADAIVASQAPAAGTAVLDTGAPLVALELSKPSGPLQGSPENSSPYSPTRVVLASSGNTQGSTTTFPITTGSFSTATTSEQTTTTTATTTTKQRTTTTRPTTSTTTPAPKPKRPGERTRPRAFVIAGARREPLDEIPLPARARKPEQLARLPSPRQPGQRQATGSTSKPGSSPGPSSAGGTERRRSRL